MRNGDKKSIGTWGEQNAARFYEKLGFKILERNFYLRGGEIDLIVGKGKQLIFVEVKTRGSHTYGLPEESITAHKKRSLSKSVEYYLSLKNYENYAWQVDLIAIEVNAAGVLDRMERIENILVDN